jgi:hypothetical protein
VKYNHINGKRDSLARALVCIGVRVIDEDEETDERDKFDVGRCEIS